MSVCSLGPDNDMSSPSTTKLSLVSFVRTRDSIRTLSRSLGDVLTENLRLEPSLPSGEIRERLSEQPGFPITFSEPRQTSVASESHEALLSTVESLVARIVRPRRRSARGSGPISGAGASSTPLDQVWRRPLQPSIQGHDDWGGTSSGLLRELWKQPRARHDKTGPSSGGRYLTARGRRGIQGIRHRGPERRSCDRLHVLPGR